MSNFDCLPGRAGGASLGRLDRQRFKADALAACYRRRWEIETSYRELKQSMLGEALTLRSRQPPGIKQEIGGGADRLQARPPGNGQGGY